MDVISHTVIRKGSSGWEAKDVIDMGAASDGRGTTGKRELVIHTYKHSNGGIHTFASCHINSAGLTTFEICGDFTRRIAALPGERCTEKSIRKLHEQVMAQQSTAILEEAVTFYKLKEAKRAAREVDNHEAKAQADLAEARVPA